ncbi:glycosyltransferase family A protein [Nitrogeniibacter aestuarii]|uniref:glycosyltransferase family A protein n=1 Tax=Nitrogeniibacter aestuarii TaxID=2815343 RepID=UPI001D0FAC07|nr:glycosyltransferase family 2 protein [Nitrogeniibacter aestuarii]
MAVEQVSVIIPTLADACRKASLARAVQSIRASSTRPVRIIAAVNGNRFDPDVVAWLDAQPDITVAQVETGATIAGISAGRQRVETEFFAFLDDDDEYLPGALDMRLEGMNSDPAIGVVATNGHRNRGDGDEPALDMPPLLDSDPLLGLMDSNWLASCGGLYRTRLVDADIFEDLPRHIHWTWVAFVVSHRGIPVLIDRRPSFRIHDSATSQSKSDSYKATSVILVERMLALRPREDVARILRRRLVDSHHYLASHYLRSGRKEQAWRHHLKSLLHPHGWRYAPFTRHLLF